MPTNGDYSSWNWENQSQNNWKRRDGNIWVDINPPFKPETERIGKIVDVYETSDYKKTKGWQLLWAQFDGIYPYFIIYNPHRGLVRAFFYLDELPFEHVLATLSFHDLNNPSSLTYGNEYQYATDKYLNSDITSDDMISVIIPFVASDNWCSVDFPIFFDQNILNNKYNSKKWTFKFYGCNNYQIRLKDKLGPASSEQHTITGSKTSISNNTFNASLSKLHKQLESNEKFISQMQNSVKKIDDSSPQYMKSYKNVVNTLKPVGEIFSAATGITAGASAVLGFVRILNGSFNEKTSTPPTGTIEHLDIEGTMSIKFNLGGNTLKIPGVNGNFFPPVSWSPYDCPLGFINLSKTPTIRKTTPYDKYELDGDNNGGQVGTQNGLPVKVISYKSYPPFYVKANQPTVSDYLGKFVKYKFEDNNVVAINKIPGLSLMDIHFALVVKLTGVGAEKIDITKQYVLFKFWDEVGKEWHIPVVNPIYKALDEGRLKIYKFDEENGNIYIGTPELPMNKLKDMVIEVPEKSEIMLRVIARFNSNYYENPIIFQANYKMNESIEKAQYDRLVWKWEQGNYHWDDYYQGAFNIELSTTNSSNNVAGVIGMSPNFIAEPGFSAVATDPYPSRGFTEINHYSFACSNSFRKGFFENEVVTDNSNKPFQIFPNPSQGRFTLVNSFETNKITSIRLLNNMGAEILNENNINKNTFDIDLHDFNPGIHILQVILQNHESYSEKILLE